MIGLERVKIKNGQKVILRKINKRDVKQIWENFNQVVAENKYLPVYTPVIDEWEKKAWYQEMTNGNNVCIVAESIEAKRSENVIGQCTLEELHWEAADHVLQLGIIVRKGYRDLGLGHQLIEYAKEVALEKDKKKIILTTLANNEMAIELYKKCGFRECGKYTKQYYVDDRYIDEIMMECFLLDD